MEWIIGQRRVVKTDARRHGIDIHRTRTMGDEAENAEVLSVRLRWTLCRPIADLFGQSFPALVKHGKGLFPINLNAIHRCAELKRIQDNGLVNFACLGRHVCRSEHETCKHLVVLDRTRRCSAHLDTLAVAQRVNSKDKADEFVRWSNVVADIFAGHRPSLAADGVAQRRWQRATRPRARRDVEFPRGGPGEVAIGIKIDARVHVAMTPERGQRAIVQQHELRGGNLFQKKHEESMLGCGNLLVIWRHHGRGRPICRDCTETLNGIELHHIRFRMRRIT
ncbi:hypothetical protein SAMN02982985_03722 [Rugamonas rubra]|uniref:Uncharacterized protein n=1 Tax=Rugamonas rubra TaxID=758825 RepID=A0A1I4Q4K8_9BURK|nr:hypothetical protein SAMN02982985_03722 [Rugamonas rubra]